jgi:predicted O-methyltransferase YrrM
MGHCQRAEDLNLGLGWIYYGLARTIRPKTAVVIGSYRGFVPLVIAKALADNLEGGRVIFIDPSLVDAFWVEPDAVRSYFASLDVTNIDHYLMTTQQFGESPAYRQLEGVGLVFIDGYHSEEQARVDYETFEPLLLPGGAVLFHDSIRVRPSRIYGEDRAYEHGVKRLMEKLKQEPSLQVFDLPFGDGVTLVQKVVTDPGPREVRGIPAAAGSDPA